MGRRAVGPRMPKSRYTRRVTTHHVPPPTAYRPITTQTIRRGTHTPTAARDDRPGWRRADTLRRKVRRRRDAPRATRRPSRDGRRRARGISFYFFRARAETRAVTSRADDAVQTTRVDRAPIAIESRSRAAARSSSVGHRVDARGVDSSATRDARVIGRWRSSATRDASMKVASTTGRSHPRIHRHPSIDATAARGCRWLFFLSRERWFGGTKRGMRACVRA